MLYRKSDSPNWRADIRIAGKRYRINTGEKVGNNKKPSVIAQQKEAALIHQLSMGENPGRRQRSPILRDYATAHFLPYVRDCRRAEKTKEYYRNGWKMLDSQPISGMRLDAITTSTAETLQIKGSGSRVNCALRTLRRILSLAEERNFIVKVPKIHLVEENERERVIEPAEEALILANAPETLRDAFLLVFDCGLRPSEAAVLRWEDVDLVRGNILVTRGKNGKKSRRYLSTSARVQEMLMRRARLSEEWVFPSPKKGREGKPITTHNISLRFTELKKKIGLPKSVVLYSGRHTFATDLTEVTGNPTKTQKALGHTSLKTTMRYVHTENAHVGAIMDARNQKRHAFGHGTDAIQ